MTYRRGTQWGLGADRDEGWQARAACRDAPDARIFFPTAGAAASRPAKWWCRRCPVRVECRDWALDVERGASLTRRHGVFGGMNPLERLRFEQCRDGQCEHPQHQEEP